MRAYSMGSQIVRTAFVLSLCLGSARASATGVTLFRNVDVFDGERIIRTTNVLVRNGIIDRIDAKLEPPEGAKSVDGAGCTLLPGLVDCHTHTLSREMLRQSLMFGVTTEMDMFCDHKLASTLRTEQREGKAFDRADLYSAGTLVTAPGGHGTEYGIKIPTIESPAEAQAFVDARIAEGSDYIKLVYDDFSEFGRKMPTLNKETMTAVINAAHKRQRLAVIHVLSRESARDAISAGADALVHLFVDEAADNPLVQLAVKRKTFIVPTLTVLRSACGTSAGKAMAEDEDLKPFIFPQVAQSLIASFPGGSSGLKYSAAQETVRKLQKAGVPILAGTDALNPGTAHGASLHGELELLVEAGLTPTQALAAATSVPSDKFQLKDRGRIAKGFAADLVLVRGDPTVDIRATRRIVGVWKQGKRANRSAFKKEVKAKTEEVAKIRNQPPPPGSESGLVSDFEGKTPETKFGAGWMVSTDGFVGGQSKSEFKVTPGGAKDSKGSLLITGTIDGKTTTRWGGAIFYPGTAPMTPVNLSSKKGISFWAKGDGKTYSIMFFAQSRGYIPIGRTFVAAEKWGEFHFKIADFDGCDGSDLMGVFFGGGADPGDFSFQIDEVRLE